MTLMLPFLPLYVEQLGVTDHAAIAEYGRVLVVRRRVLLRRAVRAAVGPSGGTCMGRKLMLIRASLGMAVAMSLIGMAQNVWQLVALRLLAGFLGGYASGSIVLVATQTPRSRSGWALGVLSAGVSGRQPGRAADRGFLAVLLIGIRWTFFFAARCRDLRDVPRNDVPDQGGTMATGTPQHPPARRLERVCRTMACCSPCWPPASAADAGQHVDRADHHRLCRGATGA